MSTFLASYNLIHELGINPSKVYVKVPDICLRLPGYDCQLKLNDVLPLYDLFYGKTKTSFLIFSDIAHEWKRRSDALGSNDGLLPLLPNAERWLS